MCFGWWYLHCSRPVEWIFRCTIQAKEVIVIFVSVVLYYDVIYRYRQVNYGCIRDFCFDTNDASLRI